MLSSVFLPSDMENILVTLSLLVGLPTVLEAYGKWMFSCVSRNNSVIQNSRLLACCFSQSNHRNERGICYNWINLFMHNFKPSAEESPHAIDLFFSFTCVHCQLKHNVPCEHNPC